MANPNEDPLHGPNPIYIGCNLLHWEDSETDLYMKQVLCYICISAHDSASVDKKK